MPPACPLLFYTSQSLPTVARPETVGLERTNRTPGRALPDPSQGTPWGDENVGFVVSSVLPAFLSP
jgi:hypothetical protein